MGKNLKGKELGKGFYQRKDGRYEAKVMIKGRKIDLYDWDLKNLKRRIAEENWYKEFNYTLFLTGLRIHIGKFHLWEIWRQS